MKKQVLKDWWKRLFVDPGFYTPATPEALKAAAGQVRFAAQVANLKRGAAVLDLACGPGRHSVVLAKNGCRVTGVDYSAAYIREARRRAKKLRVPVTFQKGDMRRIDFDAEFDLVLSLFTSFGYFLTREEDLAVLRGVRRALKPGGLFLIDTFNRGRLANEFIPRHWVPLGPRSFMLDQNRLLDKGRRMVTRRIRIYPSGKIAEKYFALHLYDKSSLSALLRKAGLKPLRAWGSFRGEPHKAGSQRLIVLARKPRGRRRPC